ncbi:MAG: hypothetical protein R2736_22310 [Solirubrobacterales bacterium]
MEEADGKGVGAEALCLCDRGAHRVGVELGQDPASMIDPLGNLEAQIAFDEWRGLLVAKVEQIRTIRSPELQHVSEPLRRDQGGDRPCALGQGVDHDRGAMEERGDVVLGPDASLGERTVDPELELRRRRGVLGDAHFAGGFIEIDDVGERAADVAGDPHRAMPALRLKHCGAMNADSRDHASSCLGSCFLTYAICQAKRRQWAPCRAPSSSLGHVRLANNDQAAKKLREGGESTKRAPPILPQQANALDRGDG